MQHKIIIAGAALLGLYLYSQRSSTTVGTAKVAALAPVVPTNQINDAHVSNVAPVAVPAFQVTDGVDSYSPYFGKTAAEMEVIRQANIAATTASGLFA